MSAAEGPRLICAGPTGIGYYAEVSRLPERDTGEWASLSGAMLLCGAAIVASEVAKHQNVSLISNNLGSSAESSSLRGRLAGLNITSLEDPVPVRGVPFDMIMLERHTGARTFVTTNYSPDPAHISRAISQISTGEDADDSSIFLYIDAEFDSPDARDTVAILNSLSFKPALSLVNLEDVSDLPATFRWINDQNVLSPTVFQMAFKGRGEIGQGDDLRSLRGSGHTAIVTTGGGGASLLSPESVRHIGCEEVPGALTIGAGAVLSGALLSTVMSERLDRVTESALGIAVREASSFVREFTGGEYRSNLFFW